MAVTTFTQEFTTPIAPSRMFKALILDSHNLIPKIAPRVSRALSSSKEMEELEVSSRLTLLKVLIVLTEWCPYLNSSFLLILILVILSMSINSVFVMPGGHLKYLKHKIDARLE